MKFIEELSGSGYLLLWVAIGGQWHFRWWL
jgi:hypothetical protein